jgi:peptidoglycan hydrolase-like protein with peptidoglycan-binding domain
MNLRKPILFMSFLLLGAFAAQVATAAVCTPFTRNLTLGTTGEDVRALQQMLNKNSVTRVASEGVGSPGNESTYFGTKTKAAVIKFQELYAQEVLTPVGLVRGSGFVGAFSRTKLTLLCVASPLSLLPATNKNPTTTPIAAPIGVTLEGIGVAATSSPVNMSIPAMNPFLVQNDTLHVKYPSNYVVHPGDTVTVYGGGFTAENNTLHIGDGLALSTLKPTLLGTLEVVIPESAPKGKFDLWVENSQGVSNKSFIIITVQGTLPPHVSSLTPTSGQIGATVTLSGSEFTAENNEIFMNVVKLKGIPSPDKKTLSFLFDPKVEGVTPELIPAGTTRGISFPVSFYVVNANGISNLAVFTVKY